MAEGEEEEEGEGEEKARVRSAPFGSDNHVNFEQYDITYSVS